MLVLVTNSVPWTNSSYLISNLLTKVSFFWDQSQDNSLSGFPAKKKTDPWLADLLSGLPIKGLFFLAEINSIHVLTRISEKTGSNCGSPMISLFIFVFPLCIYYFTIYMYTKLHLVWSSVIDSLIQCVARLYWLSKVKFVIN